jgi:hypothetical protein
MKAPKPFSKKWFALMMSEGDGTPSAKRFCYVLGMLAAIGIALVLHYVKNDALAVDLLSKILVAAGAAYAITRWAEYGSGPNPPTQ